MKAKKQKAVHRHAAAAKAKKQKAVPRHAAAAVTALRELRIKTKKKAAAVMLPQNRRVVTAIC